LSREGEVPAEPSVVKRLRLRGSAGTSPSRIFSQPPEGLLPLKVIAPELRLASPLTGLAAHTFETRSPKLFQAIC